MKMHQLLFSNNRALYPIYITFISILLFAHLPEFWDGEREKAEREASGLRLNAVKEE